MGTGCLFQYTYCEFSQQMRIISRVPGGNLRKSFFFLIIALCILWLLPFANLDIKTCSKDISKTITDRSLRFGQLMVSKLPGEIILMDKHMVGCTVFHKHNFYFNEVSNAF